MTDHLAIAREKVARRARQDEGFARTLKASPRAAIEGAYWLSQEERRALLLALGATGPHRIVFPLGTTDTSPSSMPGPSGWRGATPGSTLVRGSALVADAAKRPGEPTSSGAAWTARPFAGAPLRGPWTPAEIRGASATAQQTRATEDSTWGDDRQAGSFEPYRVGTVAKIVHALLTLTTAHDRAQAGPGSAEKSAGTGQTRLRPAAALCSGASKIAARARQDETMVRAALASPRRFIRSAQWLTPDEKSAILSMPIDDPERLLRRLVRAMPRPAPPAVGPDFILGPKTTLANPSPAARLGQLTGDIDVAQRGWVPFQPGAAAPFTGMVVPGLPLRGFHGLEPEGFYPPLSGTVPEPDPAMATNRSPGLTTSFYGVDGADVHSPFVGTLPLDKNGSPWGVGVIWLFGDLGLPFSMVGDGTTTLKATHNDSMAWTPSTVALEDPNALSDADNGLYSFNFYTVNINGQYPYQYTTPSGTQIPSSVAPNDYTSWVDVNPPGASITLDMIPVTDQNVDPAFAPGGKIDNPGGAEPLLELGNNRNSTGDTNSAMSGIEIGGIKYVARRVTGNANAPTGHTQMSILTSFDEPGPRNPGGTYTFPYVRTLSSRVGSNNAGSFIQTAFDGNYHGKLPGDSSSPSGYWVSMFGTGQENKSDVCLAMVPLSTFGSKSPRTWYLIGLDSSGPKWKAPQSYSPEIGSFVLQPLLGVQHVANMSVCFVPELGIWLMFWSGGGDGTVYFRFAAFPWGPWTAPSGGAIVMHVAEGFADASGSGGFIHDVNHPVGDGIFGPALGHPAPVGQLDPQYNSPTPEQFVHPADLYQPRLINNATYDASLRAFKCTKVIQDGFGLSPLMKWGRITVYWTVSTGWPYYTALMRTTFQYTTRG